MEEIAEDKAKLKNKDQQDSANAWHKPLAMKPGKNESINSSIEMNQMTDRAFNTIDSNAKKKLADDISPLSHKNGKASPDAPYDGKKGREEPPQWLPAKTQDDASCWTKFCAYALFYWDGIGFFGTNTAKLPRLKGAKVTFFTKFFSADWVLVQATGFVIMLYVIISEVSRFDQFKSQAVNMELSKNQTYEYWEAIPLLGGHWVWREDVVDRIN